MQKTYVSVLLLLGTCSIQFSFVHADLPEIANANHTIVNLQFNIKVCFKTLNELKEQCSVQKQEAIEGSKSKINKTIAGAEKQCEEIKEKAQENGTDVSQYYSINILSSIRQIFEKFQQMSIEYCTKETDNGLIIINEAIEFTQNCSKIVDDLPNKLKDCGTNITRIKKFIAEVENIIKQLDLRVNKAKSSVSKLKEKIESYIAKIVKEASNDANGIVAKFFEYVSSITQSSGHLPGGSIIILIEQAKKKIGNLESGLKGTIAASVKLLIQFKNQCTAQGHEAIEESKSKLNITITEAHNYIEAIKKKAHENDKNISECLVNVESSLNQVYEKFLQGEIHCVTNEINETINIINSTIKIINGYIKELQDKLRCCGNRYSCVQDLMLEVSKLENTLPMEITKQVQEVTEFVGGLQFRLQFCFGIQIAKGAYNAIRAIVENVIKCASRITKLPLDHLPEGNSDYLFQRAKEVIKKFQIFLQNKIQDALTKLNEFKNQCTAQGHEAIEESKPKLNKTIADVQLLIEEIKKKAQENGTDISKCVVNLDSNFSEIYRNCLQNENQCVTEETNKALYIINGTIEIINDSAKAVSVFEKKLNACKTSPCAVLCFQNLIEEVEEFLKNIPDIIAHKITDITWYVRGFEFRLKICAAIQIGRRAFNAAIEVVENVEKCASIGKEY